MEDAFKTLLTTPAPSLLIIAGIFFVLLGFAGKIGKFVEVAEVHRLRISIIGGLLLIVGVTLYIALAIISEQGSTPTPTAVGLQPTNTPIPSDTPTETRVPPTATETYTSTTTPTIVLPSTTPNIVTQPTPLPPPPAITDIPTVISSPTVTPTSSTVTALTVTSNDQWTPHPPQSFEDGVLMLFVPPDSADCSSVDNNALVTSDAPLCFDKSFWIDRTEVTQKQFAQFGVANPSAFSYSDPDDQHPVESITFQHAQNFCALRHARLPSEAEWRYAARGPSNWIYPWKGGFEPTIVTFSGSIGNVGTVMVGLHNLYSNSWVGAWDMSGNVAEWVTTANGTIGIALGGSWNSKQFDLQLDSPGEQVINANDRVGFRCARDV